MNREKLLDSIDVSYLSGLSYFKEKENVTLNLYEEKLTINKNLILPLDRIKDIFIKEETNMRYEDKSTIGRSIVGGIIAGPIGAVVGGLSGLGRKEIQDTIRYLKIIYIDKDNNHNILYFIIYSNCGYTQAVQRFVDKLKKKLDLNKNYQIEKIPDYPQEI
jgi:hypothetical protein